MKKIILCVFPLCLALMPGQAQKASRLVAQSLYTFDGTLFRITDTTHYTFTGSRGGDLGSRYLSYDASASLLYEPSLLKLVNYTKSLQNFNLDDHRTVTITAVWNKTIGAWEDATTVYYYPDKDDSLGSKVDQVWNKGAAAWQNLSRQTYTYNAAKSRTFYGLDFWNTTTGNWEGDERYQHEYDAANNLVKTTFQEWNKTTASWDNFFKDSFVYSPTNKVLVYTSIVWDKTTAQWVNKRQSAYTYDASDYLIGQVESGWDAGSSAWYNVQQHLLTNDSKGNMLEYLTQNWDAGGAAWINVRKRICTYDAGNNLLSNTQQMWTGTTFENSNRLEYTYDGSNNQLSESSALWDAGAGLWTNREQISATYNSYNQMTGQHFRKWNGTTSAWDDYLEGQFRHFYYEEFEPTTLAETETGNSALTIYPVPAQNNIHIALQCNSGRQLSFRITDLQGRVLQQWNATASGSVYTGQVAVSGWNAGIYFLECSGSNGMLLHRSFSVLR